jgi:hypothetical protein
MDWCSRIVLNEKKLFKIVLRDLNKYNKYKPAALSNSPKITNLCPDVMKLAPRVS